jgi:thiol-disulfide isomerase/thioredoxin
VFFCKFTLDPAAQPKAIDLIPEEGPAKGKTLRGIYSLEGDVLKICYVSPNTPEPEKKPRPSEFAAGKGSGYVLLVFRQDVINKAVLDKAGFDKAELEYARGVLAAWRAKGFPAGTREFKEQLWPKEFGKRERLMVIEDLAARLAEDWALPATVLHPVEARLAGMPAPPLEGMTWYNTGQPLAWKDLKGKVVVLDILSRGCVPCVEALPKLNALHEQFADKGLVVICVLPKEDKEGEGQVPEFVKKHNIAFPVMVDGGKTIERYRIERWGTYLAVDKTGKVIPRGGLSPHRAPTAEEIKELLNR